MKFLNENQQNVLLKLAGWEPTYLSRSAWMGHQHFAYWLINEFQPNQFVELGTHLGVSFFAICQAVKDLGLNTACHAVDSWKGDSHAGFYDDTVYSTVLQYRDKHYAEFAHLHKMLFSEALVNFEDNSVDLLHIDGFHAYEAVKDDFESWLPKLTDTAIVLFHDTHEYQDGFGVYIFWEEIQKKYKWTLEFPHAHGLGVLSLSQQETPPLPIFSESSEPTSIYHFLSTLGNKFRNDVDRLNQSLKELQASKQQVKNLAQSNAELKAELKAILQTKSWRYSAPFRRLFRKKGETIQ